MPWWYSIKGLVMGMREVGQHVAAPLSAPTDHRPTWRGRKTTHPATGRPSVVFPSSHHVFASLASSRYGFGSRAESIAAKNLLLLCVSDLT